jgi:hypothetical protein
MGGTRRGGKSTPQKPVPKTSMTSTASTMPIGAEAAAASNVPSTVTAGASSTSVPPAYSGQGSSTVSSSGNSVLFAATATTTQVVTTEATPTVATSTVLQPSIPARLDKIRDLKTACNTSITATYEWITEVQREMTALISCKKTNQRLTELLVTLHGIEAGMEYNTQVYANAVRLIL